MKTLPFLSALRGAFHFDSAASTKAWLSRAGGGKAAAAKEAPSKGGGGFSRKALNPKAAGAAGAAWVARSAKGEGKVSKESNARAPTEKDNRRIADIFDKSGGNYDKARGLASVMARVITDPDKAVRRAAACNLMATEAGASGDKTAMKAAHDMAHMFVARSVELQRGKPSQKASGTPAKPTSDAKPVADQKASGKPASAPEQQKRENVAEHNKAPVDRPAPGGKVPPPAALGEKPPVMPSGKPAMTQDEKDDSIHQALNPKGGKPDAPKLAAPGSTESKSKYDNVASGSVTEKALDVLTSLKLPPAVINKVREAMTGVKDSALNAARRFDGAKGAQPSSAKAIDPGAPVKAREQQIDAERRMPASGKKADTLNPKPGEGKGAAIRRVTAAGGHKPSPTGIHQKAKSDLGAAKAAAIPANKAWVGRQAKGEGAVGPATNTRTPTAKEHTTVADHFSRSGGDYKTALRNGLGHANSLSDSSTAIRHASAAHQLGVQARLSGDSEAEKSAHSIAKGYTDRAVRLKLGGK